MSEGGNVLHSFYCVTVECSLTALLYDTDCFIFSSSITVKYDL